MLTLFPLDDIIVIPHLEEEVIFPNNIYDYLVNKSSDKFRLPKYEEFTGILTDKL